MTLLEVVAALALAFTVVSLGARILDQVADAGHRIDTESELAARESNGQSLLRELLSQVESSTDSSKQLRGDARSLDCMTWCLTSRGYETTCGLTVTIDSLTDSSRVIGVLANGVSFVARTDAGRSEFRYVDQATDSGWRSRWQTSTALPFAVALVTSRDTIVYPLGPSRE